MKEMNDYKDLIADLWFYFDDTELVFDAALAIEQLVKERDELVAELKEVKPCKACKYLADLEHCKNCYPENHWEWRGVQDEAY